MTFNIDIPITLLIDLCTDRGSPDCFEGVLDQVIWDMYAPALVLAGVNDSSVQLTKMLVVITINHLPLEQVKAIAPQIGDIFDNLSGSEIDRRYREGSDDYQFGRKVGRGISIALAAFEVAEGALSVIGGLGALPPTLLGTGATCAAAETGVGLIACGLGVVVTGGEATLVVGGAIAVTHGNAMIILRFNKAELKG